MSQESWPVHPPPAQRPRADRLRWYSALKNERTSGFDGGDEMRLIEAIAIFRKRLSAGYRIVDGAVVESPIEAAIQAVLAEIDRLNFEVKGLLDVNQGFADQYREQENQI